MRLVDDGYVDTDVGGNLVDYWHMSFEDEELEHVEAERRPGEGSIDHGLALGEGLLRLDYLTDGDLARGPVDAEFVPWDAEAESHVIDVGMSQNEDWWYSSKGSPLADADAPVLVEVPGAVVVSEENSGRWTVVGLT